MLNTMKEKASRDWGIIQRKEKNGKLAWYARIIRVDGTGKKKQFTAKADNKSHARRLRDELERKYDEGGSRLIDGKKLRFRDVADVYESRKLRPAEYHGVGKAQRKIAGVRSLLPSIHYLKILRADFGNELINEITHAEIEDFKARRLKTRSKRGERSIADVNRSLELLRTILRFAQREGWMSKSPFEQGAPLISKADEVKRERVLSFDEEMRLLDACLSSRTIKYVRSGKEVVINRKGGPRYLAAIIITAIDTAMRKGELLKLRWENVDFGNKMITITAMNSKTAKARTVGMTTRVADELFALWSEGPMDVSGLVFGINDNFQHSFGNARNYAKIDDFRFHDLRHTAITRMINAGIPPMEVMKISGHTQWTTFARYVNPDQESINRIADVLGTYNASFAAQSVEEHGYVN